MVKLLSTASSGPRVQVRLMFHLRDHVTTFSEVKKKNCLGGLLSHLWFSLGFDSEREDGTTVS